ncbi:MAG: DinB family protein [Acidobacteriota bacterium]
MSLLRILCSLPLCAAALTAADAPSASRIFDAQLRNMEREFVPLVEAMPADKFGFAPKDGNFKGVRTFGAQAKHAAFVLQEISSALLGEKNPSTTGANENGPDNLENKDEIVKYVKDAFAYAHKAVASLTNDNLLQETTDPFNPKGKRTRVDSAGILLWHTYDHYGQMVEYLRLNNLVPPASR